jgi:hypothetical protein
MKRSLSIMLICLFFVLFGCKGEDGEDGDTGEIVTTLGASSDVTALSLNELTKTQYSSWSANVEYVLKQDTSGYIYWTSNGTTYYYWTTVGSGEKGEDGESGKSGVPYISDLSGGSGEDGRKSIYYTYFSGSTVSFDFVRYSSSILSDENTLVEISNAEIDMENAVQGKRVGEIPF